MFPKLHEQDRFEFCFGLSGLCHGVPPLRTGYHDGSALLTHLRIVIVILAFIGGILLAFAWQYL